MQLRTLAITAAATVVVACLAGCTATSTVTAPTTGPTTAPSAVVTPTVTPSPTPLPTITPLPPTKPTLYQLTVSPEGLGELVIGQPVKTEPDDLALVRFNDNHCDRPGEVGNAGWESTYHNRSFELRTAPVTASGKVSEILVTSSHLSTFVGIHIRSSVADLKAAYGKFDRVVHNFSTDLYILKGVHGQLAFEVARQVTFGADKTPYWSKTEVNRVQFMSIWRPSATPISFSGTDGGPSSCA